MHKLGLIVGVLGVLSMAMGFAPQTIVPTINPVEEFGKAMSVAGQTFFCGVHSCNKDAVDRANSIVCEIANDIAQIKVPEPISFLHSTYKAVTKSIETDSNCLDFSYRSEICKDSNIPDEIIEAANEGVRVGAALNCVKNVTNDDLKKVKEAIVEYHRHIVHAEIGSGLQCSRVMSKGLSTLAETLEEICKHN